MTTGTKKYPKLTLVGAGPGDIDLITVKGVEAIASADVILYDALVNKELLKYAPVHSKNIYVGKRNKDHSFTQDQINTLIVDYAFSDGHVVRLKGGDSFVFGRGYGELKYAETFGIETAIVPGISSSIAAPELHGIPLTCRGTSESFWVITGTKSDGELSNDIILGAQSTATLVILMGLKKLDKIVEVFKQHDRSETAIAIIQNASLPNENIVLGTIETIMEIAVQHEIAAPAVIVIGEVVKLHPQFLNSLSAKYVTK